MDGLSNLKLGDIVLDPRRVVYVQSLRALVCAGLPEALTVGISQGLRAVIERVDSALADYDPASLVLIGSCGGTPRAKLSLKTIARRWGKKARVQLIARDLDAGIHASADKLGLEVYHELVWGSYRFTGRTSEEDPEVRFTTIAGAPHFAVRVGSTPFGGIRLPIFLKGKGCITLPSQDPTAAAVSPFRPGLARSDVFAAGYNRVLPLGKVVDLHAVRGVGRTNFPLRKIKNAAVLSARTIR